MEPTSSLFTPKYIFGSHGRVDTENKPPNDLDLEYNPLLNNVILNSVFKFLNRKDLKACRLVSKKWNILTLPFMRSEFQVNIDGKIPVSWDNDDVDVQNSNRIQDFVITFRSNTLGIPFTKFKLGYFSTTDKVGQEFLQLFGNTTKEIILGGEEFTILQIEDVSELLKCMPNLESLSIMDYPRPRFSSSENTVKLFPDSAPRLIHLKKMRLRVNIYRNDDRKKLCPTFIEELLSVTPNVSELILENSEDQMTIEIAIEVINAIEKLSMESSIKKLTLFYMKSVHFESLHRMALKNPNGLKLTKLTVVKCERNVNIDLHTVAAFFKDTLETLELIHSPANINEFPKMFRLTKLELVILPEHYSNLTVNLHKIFPALIALKFRISSILFYGGYNGTVQEFFPDSDPCPNVRIFNVTPPGIPINLKTFDRILTVFPKLTELSVCSGAIKENGIEILRTIWTEMTGLESLSIFVNLETTESVDSVITGISTYTIQEIEQEVGTLTQMTKEQRRETIERLRNEYSTFPNIGNLKNLRRLYASVVRGRQEGSGRSLRPPQICMTDASAYLGLYSMENLNHLHIFDCEITPTCCEVLTEDLELKYSRFINQCYQEQYHYQE